MIRSYLRLLRITCMLSLLLPLVLITSRLLTGETLNEGIWRGIGFFTAFAVAGYLGLEVAFRRTSDSLESMCRAQADYLAGLAPRTASLSIVAAAALSLFLELAVIRWQGEDIPLFAFYKNFSLLACFAGLGLGYALARRQHILLVLALPVLAFQMLLLAVIRYGIKEQWLRPVQSLPFTEQLD